MRVVIVEDSILLQEGIVRLLAGYGDRAHIDALRSEDRFRVAISMPAEAATRSAS